MNYANLGGLNKDGWYSDKIISPFMVPGPRDAWDDYGAEPSMLSSLFRYGVTSSLYYQNQTE